MTERETDELYMRQALALAREAGELGEVPIGAVLVARGEVQGRGLNRREQAKDATRHAEMDAIREACAAMGGWRLPDATLYVTLEPCPMCAGAILNARIGRLVYGAADPKSGAAGSRVDLLSADLCNHGVEVCGGVLAEECADLLRQFFAARRR
ncbi:MAG: tRNA adenosine(34) deaminase TadA [Firmicutes bacterium]|nr:tRNA adenosine(34) deaminase TadA [Bacillota bacterium]